MTGIIALAIQHLFACGASNEAVVKFVEEVEPMVDDLHKMSRDNFQAGYDLGLAHSLAENKEKERERKRAYREMSQDKRKEPKENKYINKTPFGEGMETPFVPGPDKPFDEGHLFERFWEIYPKKVGKGAARKAFRGAVKRALRGEIIEGVKRYAASKPDPQYTKHPATWLNADCWLDEPDKPKSGTVLAGPWKPVEREPDRPKITEEERQRNLAKLRGALKQSIDIERPCDTEGP